MEILQTPRKRPVVIGDFWHVILTANPPALRFGAASGHGIYDLRGFLRFFKLLTGVEFFNHGWTRMDTDMPVCAGACREPRDACGEGGLGTAFGAGERLAFVCKRIVRVKAPEGRRTPGRCREVRGLRVGARSADWKSAIWSRF